MRIDGHEVNSRFSQFFANAPKKLNAGKMEDLVHGNTAAQNLAGAYCVLFKQTDVAHTASECMTLTCDTCLKCVNLGSSYACVSAVVCHRDTTTASFLLSVYLPTLQTTEVNR